jgi:hypothetical protein
MAGQKEALVMNASRVKVLFELEPNQARGVESESLWAEKRTEQGYLLLNSPFFVFGVSAEDVVFASEENGKFVFRSVLTQGGHSTYRLFLRGGATVNSKAFIELWRSISELGATYENANDTFVAVDIPPGRDITTIYGLFEKGEESGIWIFEEGNYEPGAR